MGDTARIAVTVTNPTSRRLLLDSGPCVIYFEVRSSAGVAVAPEAPSCPLAQWVGHLDPGESLGFVFDWRGERAGDDFLPSGSYWVRGVFQARTDLIYSAPVRIEVRH